MQNDKTYLNDVLVFGTMGNIGPEVQALLVSHGLRTAAVPFPQNLFNDEPGYRRQLSRAIAHYRPAVVFPVGHPLAMSRFKGLVGQGVPLGEILNSHKTDQQWENAVRNTKFAVEREETIRLLDSKVQLYATATELGIPQPETYSGIEAVPEGVQIVFKRDISFGGHGVYLPRNTKALQNLIAHQSPGEPYLIEKYIEGQDYSLDAVRYGNGMKTGGYRCLFAQGNGPAGYREILPEGNRVLEKMRTSAKTILDHLDYQGVCGFDFREDNAGNVLLLECNPRFTGGISSQATAGFDITWLLYTSITIS